MLCHVAAVKRLPVYHHNVGNIFLSLGTMGFIKCHIENKVCLCRSLGAWPVLHISLQANHMLSQSKSGIFISLVCSLLTEALTIQNLLL